MFSSATFGFFSGAAVSLAFLVGVPPSSEVSSSSVDRWHRLKPSGNGSLEGLGDDKGDDVGGLELKLSPGGGPKSVAEDCGRFFDKVP